EEINLETAQITTTAKLPTLKQGEYDMWRLKIEQYFQVQDYALWDVIENEKSFKPGAKTTTNDDGTSTTLILGLVTTKEKYKDVKTLFAAIQTRFGEDLNLKFFRSLPSEWNTHVVVWRNKHDLDTMSFDGLYNNFKIIEQEVKGTASSSSNAQNMAFVSSSSISTASTQVSTANLSDDTVYAFFSSQPNGSHLVYEDLKQIHKDDIEEMDLKWQLALLSMRTRRGPKNQDKRNKNQDSSRRTVNVEEIFSKAMLAIDGAGFDWSYMADDEVPTNIALMAFSDSEFNKSEFNLTNYKRGLASLGKSNLFVFYKKNEVLFCEQLVLKRDISYKDLEISMLKSELENLKQEKESNQLKIKNFDNASKSLDKLIESQIPDKSRKGLGFISYNVVPPPPTGLFLPPNLDLSNSGLEEFQQPEFEGYRPKTSKSISEDISNKVRKSPDAPLVKELVSNDKQKLVNTARPNSAVVNVVKANQGHPQKEDQGYVDSGCSRHMIGNMSYLSNFKEFDGGYVTFGGGAKGGKITSKGSLKTGKLDFEYVYFVKELQFNLFSASQMCDKKNIIYLGFFLATKDETSGILKSFITEIENLVDKKVKIIRCDNGTEFKNKVMSEFYEKKGIKREFSIARTPQQNGVAERRNRTLIEAARTMLADSKLPTTFWAEAVNTACYVQNRVLVVKPHNKTPYELFRGRTLALSFMKPFGWHVTILNVGNTKSVGHFQSCDGPKWLFDIDVLTKSMNYVSVVAGTNSNDFVGTEESIGAGHSSKETECSQDCILMPLWKDGSLFNSSSKNASNDKPQPSSDVGKKDDGVRKESGIDNQERPKNSSQDTNTAGPSINTASTNITTGSLNINTVSPTVTTASNITTTYPVPSSPNTRIHKDHSLDHVIGDVQSVVIQTLKDLSWIEAMQEELLQFKLQHVWTLVDLPHGKRAIEEGIDYDEVFAPVARIEAIRLFLAYASFKDFVVYQMDVKSAFLYGKIEEEVYRGQIDKTFFIKRVKGDIQLVQVYVDDIIFGSTRNEICTEFEKMMHKKFQMSYMGELIFFLGLQVTVTYENLKPLIKDARSRFQVTPKVSHLHVVKRIFRNLKGQHKLGLWYPKDSPFDLEAYTDSDYAGPISNSTTEAEYVDAASCCGQFWQTATTSTLDNGRWKITCALVEKVKDFYEAYLRRHLKLEDSNGISNLPTTEIFEQLSLMGRLSRHESMVPQPRSPTQTNVADEAASTGMDVRLGGATTTVTGLEAGQGSDKVVALETDSMQTKKVYGVAFTKLIKKVKTLEKIVKSSQARRKAKIVVSDDKEDLEDPSKQGRKIAEIDEDPNISLFTTLEEVYTAEKGVSTAEPVSTAGASVSTASSAKDKGKAIMEESSKPIQTKTKLQLEEERLGYEEAMRLQAEIDEEERQRIARVQEEASSFNIEEWDDIQARVEADENLNSEIKI
ncbi:putative ribonuclease H-like domain-containing protein, partial [Tanacetum coccineum]